MKRIVIYSVLAIVVCLILSLLGCAAPNPSFPQAPGSQPFIADTNITSTIKAFESAGASLPQPIGGLVTAAAGIAGIISGAWVAIVNARRKVADANAITDTLIDSVESLGDDAKLRVKSIAIARGTEPTLHRRLRSKSYAAS